MEYSLITEFNEVGEHQARGELLWRDAGFWEMFEPKRFTLRFDDGQRLKCKLMWHRLPVLNFAFLEPPHEDNWGQR
ncbi:hypothetical protein ATO13_08631 [Stappia sp. 22II-S9-Z10]|nr:hypothetical protein ATO13_08631 [Stappia sp. 22II-S9-Z10]